MGVAMELLESDTLQNKIDFPSIGKKCDILQGGGKKKEKKHPVFFHRSSGNRIQTFQSSLPAGCEVSECALVGPGACGASPEMEKAGPRAKETGARGEPSIAGRSALCISGAPLGIPP